MKKPMSAILLLILMCGIASAQPHIIYAVVWDEQGNLEPGVPVTFAYNDQSFTLKTASDGSAVFATQNFYGKLQNGAKVSVSCKYGTKRVPIKYKTFDWKTFRYVNVAGTGVTFNEPSEKIAIEYYAAAGFAVVIALGGGRYLLRRRKQLDKQVNIMTKTWYTSKMLWINTIAIVAIVAQGQFGFIIDPTTQAAILAVVNMFLRAVTGEKIVWNADTQR